MDKQEKEKSNSPEQQSIVYSANKNNATFLLEESSVLNENDCEQK